MALNLMYITNSPEVARIAWSAGVDRIFIDMEYIGKAERQGKLDTVQNHHTLEDLARVREALPMAELLCRINPIHEGTENVRSTEAEIDGAIEAGADVLMLPYFKTREELHRFLSAVNGRVKTVALFETPEIVASLDECLAQERPDEAFIGLNDLSLGYRRNFLFELLADGTVERLCEKFRAFGVPYGFGGIASIGKGMLPSEYILREHYRLGSGSVILSRSFCNANLISDTKELQEIFTKGISGIRKLEEECAAKRSAPTVDPAYFEQSRLELCKRVDAICKELSY